MIAASFTAILIAGCAKQVDQPSGATPVDAPKSSAVQPAFQTETSAFHTQLFDLSGGGWTGGDGAYSIPLPDGRVLWTFGDSFLDTVYADYSRPFTPLVNNTFVVQDGTEMTTLHGGTPENPTAYVVPDNPDHFYWTADGTVIGNRVYMFMTRLTLTGAGGAFGFQGLGTDLAVFSLPDLELITIKPFLRSTTVLAGLSIFEDEDFIYLYGTDSGNFGKVTVVMRVAVGEFANLSYFDGAGFSAESADAAPMKLANGSDLTVSNMFSVFKYGGKYRLLTQQDFFGGGIDVYTGDSPVGPWSHRRRVYDTPESNGDVWTYNAIVHPHITHPTKGMLMTYSVNSLNFADVFDDARNYRPRFIWVKP